MKKKYLSLLSVFSLLTTSNLILSCLSTNQHILLTNSNIEQWSNQTSNIAKAIILSKKKRCNTIRLLDSVLKQNEHQHNIKNINAKNNVTNYEDFKTAWGYQNKIEGLTKKDFIKKTNNTFDNNQINIKTQISTFNTQLITFINNFQEIKNHKELPLLNTFFENYNIKKKINKNVEIIKDIIAPIKGIINNLNALNTFNPKATISTAHYYKDDIHKSLFDEKNGWLNNYKPPKTGFKSQAWKELSSSLTKKENFTSWDQVALFKSSIDLNGFFYKLSKEETTLANIFDNAIECDKNNNPINFNILKFAKEIKKFFNLNKKNIINLINILIPIIKYYFFEINPLAPIQTLSTKEETNKEKRNINIKDIILGIEKIFLTKDNFIKFISKLFFSESENDQTLWKYATMDLISTKYQKSLREIFSSIKNKIIKQINNNYHFIESFWEKKSKPFFELILKELNPNSMLNFKININHLEIFLNNLKAMMSSFPKTYEKTNNIKKLMNDSDFIININNMTKIIKKISNNIIDFLIDDNIKKITEELDFNNQRWWKINESTIKCCYNKKNNETTITYNLIDKTKTKAENYNVGFVLEGNINTNLKKTKQQVLLKSLIKT